MILFKRGLCLSGSFQVTYFQVLTVFPESHGPWSACFPSVVPPTFAGSSLDAVHSLLWSTYMLSSHKWISKGVPLPVNSFNIVSVHYTFELLRDNSCIIYRYKTELKNKIQLDATYYFIMLMLGSTCFGHHYAHHQELTTIAFVTT